MDFARLTQQVDQYCERVDFSFWAEPLNAVSNAAFLVAAVGLWRLRGRLGARRDVPIREVDVLIGLLVSVGVGSALFHTLATVWAQVADVLPIVLALLWFLWIFLRRVGGCGARGTALGFGAFALATAVFVLAVPRATVNGSNTYFSCGLALLAMGLWLRRRARPTAGRFFAAAGLFVGALVCRSLDQALCAVNPYGTHFLWHLLTALTFYVAATGLLRGLDARHARGAPL